MKPKLLSLTWLILLACGGTVDLGGNSEKAGWLPSESDATADAEAGAPQVRTLYDGGGFIRAIAVDDTTLAAVIQDNVSPGIATIRTEICQLSDCRNTLQTIHTYSDCLRQGRNPAFPYYFTTPGTPIIISNGEVIWSDSCDPGEGLDILACSTQGCPEGPRTIYHGDVLGALTADADFVYSLAFPDSASGIYQIARCSRGGCDVLDTLTLSEAATTAVGSFDAALNDIYAPYQPTAMHIALSKAAGKIYVGMAAGIVEAPLDFSAEAEIFYQDTNKLDGLAVVGNNVYFAVSTMAGQIRRCATDGCGAGLETLASDQRWPNELVADSDSVYWVHNLPGNVINSQIPCAINDQSGANCTIEARVPSGIAQMPIGALPSETSVVDEIDFYSSCPLTINSHYLFWCAQRELTSFASTLRMQKR